MTITFAYKNEMHNVVVKDVIHRNDKIEFSSMDGEKWSLLFYDVEKATRYFQRLMKIHNIHITDKSITVMNHRLDMNH